MVTRRTETDRRSSVEGKEFKLGIAIEMTLELQKELRIKLIVHEEGVELSEESRAEVLDFPITAETSGAGGA